MKKETKRNPINGIQTAKDNGSYLKAVFINFIKWMLHKNVAFWESEGALKKKREKTSENS